MKIRCLDLGGSEFLIYTEDMASLFSEYRSTANHGIHIKENRKLTDTEIENLLEEVEKSENIETDTQLNNPDDVVILNKIIKLYPEVKYLVHGQGGVVKAEPKLPHLSYRMDLDEDENEDENKDGGEEKILPLGLSEEKIQKICDEIRNFFKKYKNVNLEKLGSKKAKSEFTSIVNQYEKELNEIETHPKASKDQKEFASTFLQWIGKKGYLEEKSVNLSDADLVKEIRNISQFVTENNDILLSDIELEGLQEAKTRKNIPEVLRKYASDLLTWYEKKHKKEKKENTLKRIEEVEKEKEKEMGKEKEKGKEKGKEESEDVDSLDVEKANKRFKQINDFLKKKQSERPDYDSLDKKEFKNIYDTVLKYENDLSKIKSKSVLPAQIIDYANKYLYTIRKYKKKLEESSNFEPEMSTPSSVFEKEKYYTTKLDEIKNVLENKPVYDMDRQSFYEMYDTYCEVLNFVISGKSEIISAPEAEKLLDAIKSLKVEMEKEDKAEEEELETEKEKARKKIEEDEEQLKEKEKSKYTGYFKFLYSLFDAMKNTKTEREKLQEYLRNNWSAYQKNKRLFEQNEDLFKEMTNSLQDGKTSNLKNILIFNEFINRDPSWLKIIDTKSINSVSKIRMYLNKFKKSIKIEQKDNDESIRNKIKGHIDKNISNAFKNSKIKIIVNKEEGVVDFIAENWATIIDVLKTFGLTAKDVLED